jgi:hypothetical protein
MLGSYAGRLAADAVCIWLAVWAIRKKHGLDEKLDRNAQAVRWLIVVSSFGLALLRGPEFKLIRIFAGLLLLAFLCWPNFAYHLTGLFRRSPPTPNGS